MHSNAFAADTAGTETPAIDRPPGRRRRFLVTALSLALCAVTVVVATTAIRASADAAPRPPAAPDPVVKTLLLEPLDGHDIERGYAARVEPARQAQLSFETGGTLVAVPVEEGDRVPAGTVVARLDVRLLQARREALAAARAALDSDAELAALALERRRTLEARGFVADEALDKARLDVSRLRSRMAESDAALALVDVQLDKSVLRAPFDALVGERHLDPGAMAATALPVLSLLQAGAPRLRVGLPPERLAALDRSRTYSFTLGERTIPARLIAVRGDVDTRTRTVSTLFEPLDASADTLQFGQLLQLRLQERVPGAVFEVPISALIEDRRGLWSVMTVTEPASEPASEPTRESGNATIRPDDDGTRSARLRRIAVNIEHLDGERAWISTAMSEPGRIIADGTHRVVEGERVRVRLPAGESLPGPAERKGNDDGRRVATGEGNA